EEGSRKVALVWMGLYGDQWEALGKWLWGPGRAASDFELFHALLGEWALLRRPMDAEALFVKAPLTQVWQAAEVLAQKGRVADAAAIGRKLVAELPTPVMQLGGQHCLTLVKWELILGELVAAEGLLREIAKVPAESLDAPTYAAQRALYLL